MGEKVSDGVIHSSDGHSYEIDLDNLTTGLKNYNFLDMKINIIGSNWNIQRYELVHKDGKKEVFDIYGAIERIEDKYGNQIRFGFPNLHDGIYRITDSMERKYRLKIIQSITERKLK